MAPTDATTNHQGGRNPIRRVASTPEVSGPCGADTSTAALWDTAALPGNGLENQTVLLQQQLGLSQRAQVRKV
jgi:hypothetical protein